MACGCQNTCGCTILGDGVTAAVAQGPGAGTFTVSAILPIVDVEDSDCVDLTIDPDLNLRADLIFSSEPGPVTLECTPDGLAGDLVIDPASTAIVTTGDDGLRVDVPPVPAGAGSGRPGDLILHFGIGTRADAIDADGDEVTRAGYPALHDALSLVATGGERTSGDPVIASISGTRFVAIGMPLEATGFPFGTTVVAVTSTTITASAPADTSGSDTEVRVYPHGNGDGVSTFNTPDGNEVFPLGYDYQGGANELGASGGAFGVVMAAGNLALHNHVANVNDPTHDHGASGNDSGHAHPIGDDGSHSHEAGTARDQYFVTVDDTGILQVTVEGGGGGTQVSIPSGAGAPREQGTRSATSTDGDHDHGGATGTGNASITVDIVPGATGITVDIDDAGSADPDPIDITPPYNVVRWMVHT